MSSTEGSVVHPLCKPLPTSKCKKSLPIPDNSRKNRCDSSWEKMSYQSKKAGLPAKETWGHEPFSSFAFSCFKNPPATGSFSAKKRCLCMEKTYQCRAGKLQWDLSAMGILHTRNPGITYREMRLGGLGSCNSFQQKIGATLSLSYTNTMKKGYQCFLSYFPLKNVKPLTGFFFFFSFFLPWRGSAGEMLRVTAQPPPSSLHPRLHPFSHCPDYGQKIAAACSSPHSPPQPCGSPPINHLRDAPCGIRKGAIATAAAQHTWRNLNR